MSPKDKITKVGEQAHSNILDLSKTLRSFVLTAKEGMTDSEFIQYRKKMDTQVKSSLKMAGADPSKAIGIVDLVFDLGVSINDIPTKLNNILND